MWWPKGNYWTQPYFEGDEDRFTNKLHERELRGIYTEAPKIDPAGVGLKTVPIRDYEEIGSTPCPGVNWSPYVPL